MSVSNVTNVDTLFSIRIDTQSASLTYIGEAAAGTLDSSPAWRIRKLETTGSVLSVSWADGDLQFDNVWNDRLSLFYT